MKVDFNNLRRQAMMTDLMRDIDVRCGDVLRELRKLPSESVHCVITSPPYWKLRDYGFEGQLGLEKTPREFIRNMVKVFRHVRRVLKDDGTCWVNMGDAHVTSKVDQRGFPLKGKMMMPHRLAIALQDDGWIVRQDIVWHKQQPQPETVHDRPTTAHEYLFLLAKQERYVYDAAAIAEPTSEKTNARSSAANALRPREQRDAPMGGKLRMTVPSGWSTGADKPRSAVEHSASRLFGVKNNESYSFSNIGLVPTRNKRSVWPCYTDRMDLKLCTACQSVYTASEFAELAVVNNIPACSTCWNAGVTMPNDAWLSHFAAFGAEWIEPAVLAGCPKGGVVLDPFAGTGTTGGVAVAHEREAILIEGNQNYVPLIPYRVEQVVRRLREAPAPPTPAPGQMSFMDALNTPTA